MLELVPRSSSSRVVVVEGDSEEADRKSHDRPIDSSRMEKSSVSRYGNRSSSIVDLDEHEEDTDPNNFNF